MTTTLRSIHWLLLPLGLVCSACDDDNGNDDTGGATTQNATTMAMSGSGSSDSTGPSDPDSSTGMSAGTMDTSADDPTGAATDGAGLEIAGEWFEALGSKDGVDHIIDDERWAQQGPFGNARYDIESYDNPGRWVVAQGDASNEFFPDLYSKFIWTWDGPDLYYCTAVFDAETAADAMAAPDPDVDDLEFGCAGFAWSRLMPAP
ncbi:MAG: hypothetical protein AAGF11_40885 [Myxococcota bacterium]